MGAVNRYCNQSSYLWSDKATISGGMCLQLSTGLFWSYKGSGDQTIPGFVSLFFSSQCNRMGWGHEKWSNGEKTESSLSKVCPLVYPFILHQALQFIPSALGIQHSLEIHGIMISSIVSSYLCSCCIKMIKIVICCIFSHLLKTKNRSSPLKYLTKYLNCRLSRLSSTSIKSLRVSFLCYTVGCVAM